jgi:hypothetical protein
VFGYFYIVSINVFLQMAMQMGRPRAGPGEYQQHGHPPAAAERERGGAVRPSADHDADLRRRETVRHDRAAPHVSLTDFQIIMGKFIGAVALYALMLAVTLPHMAVLFIYGNPNGSRL